MNIKVHIVITLFILFIGCQSYDNRGETLNKGDFEVYANSIFLFSLQDIPDFENEYTIIYSPYIGFKYGIINSLSAGVKICPLAEGLFEAQLISPYIQYGKKWGNHGLGLSTGVYFVFDDNIKKQSDSIGYEASICYRYTNERWAVYTGATTSAYGIDAYCGGEFKYKTIKLYCSVGAPVFKIAGHIYYISINPGIAFVF